jgi:hypothetical protein
MISSAASAYAAHLFWYLEQISVVKIASSCVVMCEIASNKSRFEIESALWPLKSVIWNADDFSAALSEAIKGLMKA